MLSIRNAFGFRNNRLNIGRCFGGSGIITENVDGNASVIARSLAATHNGSIAKLNGIKRIAVARIVDVLTGRKVLHLTKNVTDIEMPIIGKVPPDTHRRAPGVAVHRVAATEHLVLTARSEEHPSELQSLMR